MERARGRSTRLRYLFATLACLAASLIGGVHAGFAAVLAGWDVHALAGGTNNFGPSPIATSVSDSNLTVGGLTRGSGVGTTGSAAARAWGGLAWSSASASAAIAANQVVTFTVAAKSGYNVSFSSIGRFDYRRSATGPASGVLQYQVGAGSFVDVTSLSYASSSSSGASLAAIDLSGISALQNVPADTTVTFRIANYGGGASGTWYLYDVANSAANDFEVQGTVSTASTVVDGACGGDNGTAVAAASPTNLCSSGLPSEIAGSGHPWTWTCDGTGGGAPASCSATIASYTVNFVTDGNGTLTGATTQAVDWGGSTQPVTASPATDFAFSEWTGSNGFGVNRNPLTPGPVLTETLTLDGVKGNSTVTARFAYTGSNTYTGNFTLFHVNDTHARLTPHWWSIPGHGPDAATTFEEVGGAAHLAGEMLALTAASPRALVIDAGDISEGNPLGDLVVPAPDLKAGNGAMVQFYRLLSAKLKAQRGRGMDTVVVGNHDVRDVNYIQNLEALEASGVPVLSVNVCDKGTQTPHFSPYNIVTIDNKRVGILGYTTQAAEVGASLSNTLDVVNCDWNSTDGTKIHLAAYVNYLRNTEHCDLVVLAAHIGHSALVDPAAPLLVDDASAVLPEIVVTGHWHTWAETGAWQPSMLNYKTIFTEAGSYMKYIGELQVTNAGKFVSGTNHVLRNADITPDPDIEAYVAGLTSQYNADHPGQAVDRVLGYTADDLYLDNDMKWWSAEEYPWSGNNTAGQWICDAMQWKAARLFAAQGGCDLAFETGGGVRADIPAGPVTYLQVYETFPWSDDTFYRINMTGQEIVTFLKATNLDAGFSRALDVTAFDGVPTDVKVNGAAIDLSHTYTVGINSYMYAHPPTGVTWSDTNPLKSSVLCRDGIVEYMGQFTQQNPYSVGGARYHLNTEFSGGYRAVVTMMNDNDTKPTFDDAFVRLLSANPETLQRRGSLQVPADLVNPDGSVNPANRLSAAELYRSFLGFKTGALHAGDIVETWGKGSSYGGNPEFVDQEGIYADGVEFKVVGHDESLAKPIYLSSVGAFWNDAYKNQYVEFLATKTGTSTVADQYGASITVMDVTAYAQKTLPGNVGDTLLLSGVPTMESFGLRFRCDKAVVSNGTPLPPALSPASLVAPMSPATTTSSLTLTAAASVGTATYSFTPVADAQVASGNPTTNYGTTNNLYLQSSTSGFGNERAWLRFDLSALPAGAAITGASLQLWNWKSAGASLPAEVRGSADDTWTEGGITWNTQPAFGAVLDTETLAAGALNVWYNWNVTPFVQQQWAGDKLVSLLVKPVTESSPDATAPSYGFDAKEYGSNAPVLQVTVQANGGSVAQVQYFYRYSADNVNWGAWTSAGTATAAPYTLAFSYPQGYGYYEFYSVATDTSNHTEQAPPAAESFVHYAAAPPYPTDAIVSVSNQTLTYDSLPKAAPVTTIPPGLSVNVTYNGSPAVPVNAGTYAVAVNVTQPGYTGTANGTLMVARAPAAVSLGNLSQVYDGSPKPVSVSTSPNGVQVRVTYGGSTTAPVNAGLYAAVASVIDPNYVGSGATGSLQITPAPAVITSLGNLNQAYDGNPKAATVTTSPAGVLVSVTYNGSPTPPTNAGTYSVVATISDSNYQGSPAYGTLTISGGQVASSDGDVPFLPPEGLFGLAALLAGGGALRTRRRRAPVAETGDAR